MENNPGSRRENVTTNTDSINASARFENQLYSTTDSSSFASQGLPPQFNSRSPLSMESSHLSLASNSMGDLIPNSVSRTEHFSANLETRSGGSGRDVGGRNLLNWESSSSIHPPGVKFQDSSSSNFGRSYSTSGIEGVDLSGSQEAMMNQDRRQQIRGSSIGAGGGAYDLGSLSTNLPSNNSTDVYSFDPWSPPSSSQQQPRSNSVSAFSSSSFESYPSSSSPPTISNLNPSRSNSTAILPPPSTLSYQEHIWSRSNQEQTLALKQRQQREQLQLQLQQQDEWYHQEAYQRQQQQGSSQQGMDGSRSYSSGRGVNSNAYEIPTSPPTVLSNNSTSYTFPPPSPALQFESSSSYPTATSTLHSGSSSDNSPYLIDREGNHFQLSPQPTSSQGSYVAKQQALQNRSGDIGVGSDGRSWSHSSQDDRREQRPAYSPLPPQQRPQSHQFPSTLSSPNPTYSNNSHDQMHSAYSAPPNRQQSLPLGSSRNLPSSSSSQLPYPSNRLQSSPFNDSPFSSDYSSVNYASTISRPSSRQQSVPKARSGVVETLKSGLPVVPDRSPFAMWTGNVPGDTTLEELEKFFNNRPGPGLAPLSTSSSSSPSSPASSRPPSPSSLAFLQSSGVESIHLISRSNCAFINYLTAAHLHHSISTTNGLPLRPLDRRCKPLLCRVRMREDDAKSGVGAQRGGGLHKGYIAALLAGVGGKGEAGGEKVEREKKAQEEEEEEEDYESSGSTSSSSLMRHFPKRFFILKSHNNEDLEKSVETGLWSTQSHNESVLDQAYRTAKDGVYFVFSANKSGEWFGYAKMAGPIGTSPSTEWSSSNSSLAPAHSLSGTTSVEASNSRVGSSENVHGAVNLQAKDGEAEFTGKPFKVEWIKVQKMPFIRTRHILNSFNSSREVKISRDGTEIEPVAGDTLLRQFWFEPKRLPGASNHPPTNSSVRRSKKPLSGTFPSYNPTDWGRTPSTGNR